MFRVDGQPDARGTGIDDAVAEATGQEKLFPGGEADFPPVREGEARLASDKEHPLVGILIIPRVFRGDVPPGNDALHPQAVLPDKQRSKIFLAAGNAHGGGNGKKIFHIYFPGGLVRAIAHDGLPPDTREQRAL